jgi:RHS repeat-associated protein
MSPATHQPPIRSRRCAGSSNHASRVDPESSVPGVVSPRRNCRKTRCQTQPAAKTRVRRFHRNQQYSITALTDGSGSVVERYAYSAYGQVTFANASGTVQSTSVSNNRYTYTGREWDEGLGLYHYRARMYDAVGGRFVSRDPIGFAGSMWNVYFYVDCSPLAMTDPTGNVPSVVIGGGLGCIGGGMYAAGTGWWKGRSGKNIACRAGIGCLAGGVPGLVGGANPALAKCMAGVAYGLSSSLPGIICDEYTGECSNNQNLMQRAGCHAARVLFSGLVSCLAGQLDLDLNGMLIKVNQLIWGYSAARYCNANDLLGA